MWEGKPVATRYRPCIYDSPFTTFHSPLLHLPESRMLNLGPLISAPLVPRPAPLFLRQAAQLLHEIEKFAALVVGVFAAVGGRDFFDGG